MTLPVTGPEEAPAKAWWTAREIANHYEISVRLVYDAIASGRLHTHRFGQGRGGIRIADVDRLAWETACRNNGVPRPAGGSPLAPTITTSPLVSKHFGRPRAARGLSKANHRTKLFVRCVYRGQNAQNDF